MGPTKPLLDVPHIRCPIPVTSLPLRDEMLTAPKTRKVPTDRVRLFLLRAGEQKARQINSWHYGGQLGGNKERHIGRGYS